MSLRHFKEPQGNYESNPWVGTHKMKRKESKFTAVESHQLTEEDNRRVKEGAKAVEELGEQSRNRQSGRRLTPAPCWDREGCAAWRLSPQAPLGPCTFRCDLGHRVDGFRDRGIATASQEWREDIPGGPVVKILYWAPSLAWQPRSCNS